jgi:hypothetical protein
VQVARRAHLVGLGLRHERRAVAVRRRDVLHDRLEQHVPVRGGQHVAVLGVDLPLTEAVLTLRDLDRDPARLEVPAQDAEERFEQVRRGQLEVPVRTAGRHQPSVVLLPNVLGSAAVEIELQLGGGVGAQAVDDRVRLRRGRTPDPLAVSDVRWQRRPHVCPGQHDEPAHRNHEQQLPDRPQPPHMINPSTRNCVTNAWWARSAAARPSSAMPSWTTCLPMHNSLAVRGRRLPHACGGRTVHRMSSRVKSSRISVPGQQSGRRLRIPRGRPGPARTRSLGQTTRAGAGRPAGAVPRPGPGGRALRLRRLFRGDVPIRTRSTTN